MSNIVQFTNESKITLSSSEKATRGNRARHMQILREEYTMEYKGEYYFLSNSHYSKIKIGDYKFLNAKAAFLSHKDKSRQGEFQDLLPSEAKDLAKDISVSKDWEELRLHYLYNVMVAKFEQNAYLKNKLKRIHPDLFNDDEHGNILRLVQNHVKRSDKLADMMNEQIEGFDPKLFE